MLSCAGADRLQTGMRGAWGKPYGTVARVNIGQIILSIRCKDSNAHVIQEALRRARYKFPGRQKIIVSKKWGFTNVDREEYLKLKEDKRVVQCVSVSVSLLSSSQFTDCMFQRWRLCSVYPPERTIGSEPSCSAESVGRERCAVCSVRSYASYFSPRCKGLNCPIFTTPFLMLDGG